MSSHTSKPLLSGGSEPSSPTTRLMTTNSNGYLSLVLGPMFSGKTSSLISKYREINRKKVVVNYAGDTRYNVATILTSHDGVTLPCIQAFALETVMSELLANDVIFINEAQFFTDLQVCVLELVNDWGKEVYVYGLDGDFRHERFGSVLDLIPESDEVIKLRAICSTCGQANRAIFSQRLTGESEQVVIGSNNYAPLCRKCHLMQKSVYE